MPTMFEHIVFFGMFVWFIWPILMLAVTLITPKKLLVKYFKEPHFNAGELVAFSSFPTFLMRTALFCRLYLTPKAVKGRKLNGFVEDSPTWYRISVISACLGLIIHGLLVILPMSLVYVTDHFFKT